MRSVFCLLVFLTCLFPVAGAWAGATIIKVALVTPDGSTWTETMREMARDVKKQTDGQVDFKIYAGGVSGDELDVLRKMRANRIHAAGFSGVGLGVVLPEVRILEAPLLFNSYQEVDTVKDALFDEFSADFEKKGFVLLGFAEAGFVYFFSSQPLDQPSALRSVKMWTWKGDPVAEAFLKTFGITTYPLHLADVNTGLETGMIDSFYSPPLAAIAFQWHTRVKYMLDYPMVNSTGAVLMNRQEFMRLGADQQQILRSTVKQYARRLVEITRKENATALGELATSGVQPVPPSAEQITLFKVNAQKTYQQNIPELYSQGLFDRVQGILGTYRSTHAKATSP
ncbi:MAG: TRAP transporter substrate-binding protein DctP [Pseudomonadota bacterium]